MAVSMDDDVPLILTLDDSGSSASAPLDDLDREELPNESKITLSFFPALCRGLAGFPLCAGASFLLSPGPEPLRAVLSVPGKISSGSCLLRCLFILAPTFRRRGGGRWADRSCRAIPNARLLWFLCSNL